MGEAYIDDGTDDDTDDDDNQYIAYSIIPGVMIAIQYHSWIS